MAFNGSSSWPCVSVPSVAVVSTGASVPSTGASATGASVPSVVVSVPFNKSASKLAVSLETEEPSGVSPDGSVIFVSVKSCVAAGAGSDDVFFSFKTYFSSKLFFLTYRCYQPDQRFRWFVWTWN